MLEGILRGRRVQTTLVKDSSQYPERDEEGECYAKQLKREWSMWLDIVITRRFVLGE